MNVIILGGGMKKDGALLQKEGVKALLYRVLLFQRLFLEQIYCTAFPISDAEMM